MTKIAVKLIKYYQYLFRFMAGNNIYPLFFYPECKFYPTCSEYTIESINKYGILKGSGKGIIRILKCNPLAKHGPDLP